MKVIGSWIADILNDVENIELQASVRKEVAKLTAQFLVP
jgi:glycine/serine hydroxymethyltransferase